MVRGGVRGAGLRERELDWHGYDEANCEGYGRLGPGVALLHAVGRQACRRRQLDVGCGTGHVFARMATRWRANSLQLSSWAASQAR